MYAEAVDERRVGSGLNSHEGANGYIRRFCLYSGHFFFFFTESCFSMVMEQSEEILVVVVDTYTRVFLSIFSISWNFHLCWNKNQISVYLEEIT